jgi:hypothetical protein
VTLPRYSGLVWTDDWAVEQVFYWLGPKARRTPILFGAAKRHAGVWYKSGRVFCAGIARNASRLLGLFCRLRAIESDSHPHG